MGVSMMVMIAVMAIILLAHNLFIRDPRSQWLTIGTTWHRCSS